MHSLHFFPKKGNKLAFLKKPLDVTFQIIDRYIDVATYDSVVDVPYFINERASLGLFVGGIWRADPDNMVLEEFGCDKVWGKGTYAGRQDVWFRVAGKECFAEAKQIWPHLPMRKKGADRYLNVLSDEAEKAQLNNSDASFALGIVFLVPYLEEKWIARVSHELKDYHGRLDAAISSHHLTTGRHLVWGKYQRPELVGEAGLCQWRSGRVCATPAVDILFELAERKV